MNECNDPYFLLDLSCEAHPDEIRAAFQKKLSETSDRETLVAAYGKIRGAGDRNRQRFDSIDSFLKNPLDFDENVSIKREELIRELAFLSAWEAGDDSCLK